MFSLEESAPDPPTFVDCDKLRQYALESEVLVIKIKKIIVCNDIYTSLYLCNTTFFKNTVLFVL